MEPLFYFLGLDPRTKHKANLVLVLVPWLVLPVSLRYMHLPIWKAHPTPHLYPQVFFDEG